MLSVMSSGPSFISAFIMLLSLQNRVCATAQQRPGNVRTVPVRRTWKPGEADKVQTPPEEKKGIATGSSLRGLVKTGVPQPPSHTRLVCCVDSELLSCSISRQTLPPRPLLGKVFGSPPPAAHASTRGSKVTRQVPRAWGITDSSVSTVDPQRHM